MANIIEFKAGNRIDIEANENSHRIKFSSVDELSANQKAALNNPLAKEENKFVTESEVVGRIVKEIIDHPEKLDKCDPPEGSILLTTSGEYTIPEDGYYEIRFCGGGASGNGVYSGHSTYDDLTFTFKTNNSLLNAIGKICEEKIYSAYSYAFFFGAGGSSGFLKTLKLNLKANNKIEFTIGAGGTVYNPPNSNHIIGRWGNHTSVRIHNLNYLAFGGVNIRITAGNYVENSTPALVPEPYDGIKGATRGGNGIYHDKRDILEEIIAQNGACRGGVNGDTYHGFCGGGGGGVIPGDISAGKGGAKTAARGYGAGGGGICAPYGSDELLRKVLSSGYGAQGAVLIQKIGELSSDYTPLPEFPKFFTKNTKFTIPTTGIYKFSLVGGGGGGGIGGSSSSNIFRGGYGGSTSIIIDGITYTARGGIGGISPAFDTMPSYYQAYDGNSGCVLGAFNNKGAEDGAGKGGASNLYNNKYHGGGGSPLNYNIDGMVSGDFLPNCIINNLIPFAKGWGAGGTSIESDIQGGSSGFLFTKDIHLTEGTEIDIKVGAGGVRAVNPKSILFPGSGAPGAVLIEKIS